MEGIINMKGKDKTLVRLHGLVKHAHLNGKIGWIAKRQDPAMARIQVDIMSPWKDPRTGPKKGLTLSLKAEHLEILEEENTCPGCNQVFATAKMLTCSRCRLTKYCSKECQKRDWKTGEHKEDCTLIRVARKSTSASVNPDDEAMLPTNRKDRLLVRHQRAQCFWGKGNFGAAEKEFLKLIDVEEDISAKNELVVFLCGRKRFDEALVRSMKGISHPTFVLYSKRWRFDAYLNLAIIHAHLGNYTAAETARAQADREKIEEPACPCPNCPNRRRTKQLPHH
jgi:tetratricopeptide (TPR) repeat protein